MDLEEWWPNVLVKLVMNSDGKFPTRPQTNNAASNLDDRVQVKTPLCYVIVAKISQVLELSKLKL